MTARLLIALIILTQGAFAQDFLLDKSVRIYSPTTPGATASAWGSGAWKEITKLDYHGAPVLEVTSRDLREGLRIDFTPPLDLTKAIADPNAYLQVVAVFGADQSTVKTPGRAGMPTPIGGPMGGPGAPPAPMPGTVAAPGRAASDSERPATIMRVMLVTDKGSAECEANIAGFGPGDDGWIHASFPLAVLAKGLDDSKVNRLVISTNGSTPFYLSEVLTTSDTTPLSPSAGSDREIARYDRIALQGSCDSGGTPVRYSWDFDDSDGIQEEAVGPVIAHQFRQSGNFVVTLTVTDPFGIKDSASSTVNIEVNP
ncbi:MAG: PKD domain-containing protein [Armatimonadota bacterium]